jgi:hypothetical protein
MEEGIFHRPAVAGELKRFVEARLHLDHASDDAKNAASDALARKLGVNPNVRPSFVVVDPRTGNVIDVFPGSTRDDAEFATFLKKANGLPAGM